MATTSLDLSRSYTSFGGTDIKAVIGGKPIGQMQAVSYAIQREKAPIYVMGRVDPLSFSRGKRGIAGTMISLLLDQHMLLGEPFSDMKYLADKDEIFVNVGDLTNAEDTRNLTDPNTAYNAVNVEDSYEVRSAYYVDQLPPFDIVLIAVNEYGKAATMRIFGAEILNEGSGFSIDDMQIETQATYVCRTILPWQKLGDWNLSGGSFTPAPSRS